MGTVWCENNVRRPATLTGDTVRSVFFSYSSYVLFLLVKIDKSRRFAKCDISVIFVINRIPHDLIFGSTLAHMISIRMQAR